MKKTIQTYWPALLIFIISVIVGIVVYQDYGLAWDEETQRNIGYEVYTYMTGNNPDFLSFKDHDYGPGFELPLIFIEKAFNITDLRNIFLMRHLVTYLFFVSCMLSGYVLVYKTFNNKLLASIALIALIFHPRIFAHGFFNTKDIPNTGIFLLTIATARWAFAKNKLLPFLVLGVLCGYGLTIRLTNLIVIAAILGFVGVDVVNAARNKGPVLHHLKKIAVMVFAMCLTTYICWPFLWGHPFSHLAEAFGAMSKFVRFEGANLFQGMVMPATKVPWSYVPTYLFITTPELWLILGIIGIIIFSAKFIDTPWRLINNMPERAIVLTFICLFGPLLAVIILKSVLYDGWRHLYFIYPPFVIMAMYGLNELLKKKSNGVLWAICGLQVVMVVVVLIRIHPYQNLYFNSFVSHDENYLKDNYEQDYWGLSNKDALEWIVTHSDKEEINIYSHIYHHTFETNYRFLPEDKRRRLREVMDEQQADYIIELYRTYPFQYPNDRLPGSEIAYEVRVQNSPVLRVIKAK